MNFYYASHWKGKNDTAKTREYLDKALADDPSNLDVLIASYRIAEPKSESREKIIKLIRKIADALQAQIDEDADGPEAADNCNQLAWLSANTDGKLDDALRLAKKAVELKPDNASYYDTLSRVYAAKEDFENAVKSESKAVQLEPHSKQIREQLESYRKKLGAGEKKK